MAAVINFYRTNDKFGCFSNFAPYPFTLNGQKSQADFPSTMFQKAQKFAGTAIRGGNPAGTLADDRRPHGAEDRKTPLRPDWEAVKDDIMRDAVRTKFRQHAELRAILAGTGDAKIVEHTEKDAYWGDGGDGSGKNMLGRILMEIREELRATPITHSRGTISATSRRP